MPDLRLSVLRKASTLAKLELASSRLKIVEIDSRKMTLIVFKQLPEIVLGPYDRDELWILGRINYHPDRCDAQAEHVHVLLEELATGKVLRGRLNRDAHTHTSTWIEAVEDDHPAEKGHVPMPPGLPLGPRDLARVPKPKSIRRKRHYMSKLWTIATEEVEQLFIGG